MLNILKLFGRSPFAPLQSHMNKVSECVVALRGLFDAIRREDTEAIEKISHEISEMEHAADLIKNDIRNNLPKSLFLSIDRGALLEILSMQDSLADKAEDVAVLATFKPLKIHEALAEDLEAYLEKSIEVFHKVRGVIHELDELIEASFGGIEADKVRSMVEEVAYGEHQVDIIQRRIVKTLYNLDDEISYSSFYLWQRILSTVAAISNISEKLAFRVQMTLEL